MNKFCAVLIALINIAAHPLFGAAARNITPSRLMGKFNCSGPIRSTPSSDRDTVYIGCDNGYVFALQRKDSSPRWTFRADAAVSSKITTAGDLLFFASKRGTIYAVYQHQHPQEGKEAWSFRSKPRTMKLYGGGWDYFVSSPVIAGDLIIAGSGDNNIYALQRQTGKLVWQYDTGAAVRSTPALDEKKQTVFCGTLAGRLLALDVKSGKLKWQFQTSGSKYFPKGELFFEPLVYKNTVYAGSRDANFYAVNAADGTLRWKVNDPRGAWYTTAAAANGTIFAASSDGHYIQALDYSSGKEKWNVHMGDLVFSTPLIEQGILYVGSHDNYIYAVDTETGKIEWRFKATGDVLGSALIDQGMLIIGSDDGFLYGLRAGKAETAAAKKHLAVYWDPQLDATVTARNAKIHDAREIYRFFRDSGYETLDGPGLEQSFKKRIDDKQASSSVIILASVVFPYSIYQEQKDPAAPSLLRQYLDAGGTIVSLGYPPFVFAMKEGADKPEVPSREIMAALDIDKNFLYHGFFYYDAYFSYPTEAGKQLGMPQWWSSGYGVDPKKVTTVLAIDEHGRAAAWIKSYGGPQGTGLIRLWGSEQLPDDLEFIKIIAER